MRRRNYSPIIGHSEINITNKHGNSYTYSYSRILGIVIAFTVGLLSGLLGIGGGILHAPLLTQVLCFPVHIVTTTSHFVVGITTSSVVITHILTGAYTREVRRAAVLS